MAIVNKVFKFPGERRLRLLHDEMERALVWFYDIDDPKGLPLPIPRLNFARLVKAGKAVETDDIWLSEFITNDNLTTAERNQIERLWNTLSPYLFDMPRVLIRRSRGELFAEISKEKSISRPTLMKAFRQFWQRGLTKSSLLPGYRKCGGPGKRRKSPKMLGRPREDGVVGTPVTEELIKLMQKFWKKSYLSKGRTSLKGAYERFDGYLVEKLHGASDGDLEEFVEKYGQTTTPSFRQFQYWFHVYFNPYEVLLARKGKRHIEGHVRLLLDNTRNEVRGIGSRYVFDATIADCHIVSSIDRNRIIGRPTVYLITDVATRLIVGFYVGLEPPSYEAAMMALLNVFEDKVAMCAKYGITITEDMWPNAPSCLILLTDGGEMMSLAAAGLVGVVFQEIETAAPFRGDAKSIVERLFGIIQMSFTTFMPGYVEKPNLKRGERDPRLDAAYTLEAFTKSIILAIIRANNIARRDFDGPTEVIESGKPYIPTELWKYYESQRLVDAPHLDYNYVARAVRPRKTVKVVRRCVRFSEGLYYSSEELITQDWFLTFSIRNGELVAAYDSSNMTHIEVWSPDNPKKTFQLQLTPHSKRFSGCSLCEVNAIRKRERTNIKDFYQGEGATGHDPEAVAAFVAAEQEAIRKSEMAARQAELDPDLSDRSRRKDIRANRQEELKRLRQARAGGPIEGVATQVDEDRLQELPIIDEYTAEFDDDLSRSIARRIGNDD